jgi:hypothetical protein
MEMLLQKHLEEVRAIVRAELARHRRDETDRSESGDPRPEPETISIAEAANSLKCRRSMINKRLKNGRLIRYRPPGAPRTPVRILVESPALKGVKVIRMAPD